MFDVALDSKVSPIEVPFLDDQRGARCMYIGNIDTDALRRVELSSAREAAEEARRQREVNRLSQVPNPDNTNCMVVGDRRNDVAAADIATSDVNQKAGPSASATDTNPEPDDIHKPTSSQNRLLLATVSREADRMTRPSASPNLICNFWREALTTSRVKPAQKWPQQTAGTHFPMRLRTPNHWHRSDVS